MSIRIEVTDRHGTVAEIIDPDEVLGKLNRHERQRLDALVADLVLTLEIILKHGEDHARKVAIAELLRLIADEDAYERVAERRGVLPL